MASQEEVEALHRRVADFVLQYMRSSGNPAINARPLVHCKTGVTHIVIPVTGCNEFTWTLQLAQALERAFPPDAHMRTRALPDASQFVYELVVPLAAGMTNRHRSKHRNDGQQTVTTAQGTGFMDNPLMLILLLFGLVIALVAGWLMLDKL